MPGDKVREESPGAPPEPYGKPTTIRLDDETRERVAKAARNASRSSRARVTPTDYMRYAIQQQLERDGYGREQE